MNQLPLVCLHFFVVALVRRWDRHSRSYYALNILADKHLILQNAKRPLFKMCTTTDRISHAICLSLSVPIRYTHRYDIAEMCNYLVLYYMISSTLILSHVICALCTHETNEPKKVERTSTLDYVCENIYRILGENICFRSANFFFSFLMLYWIAYWYPIVVNVLLHVFVFGSMLFFFLFICSAVYFFPVSKISE